MDRRTSHREPLFYCEFVTISTVFLPGHKVKKEECSRDRTHTWSVCGNQSIHSRSITTFAALEWEPSRKARSDDRDRARMSVRLTTNSRWPYHDQKHEPFWNYSVYYSVEDSVEYSVEYFSSTLLESLLYGALKFEYACSIRPSSTGTNTS